MVMEKNYKSKMINLLQVNFPTTIKSLIIILCFGCAFIINLKLLEFQNVESINKANSKHATGQACICQSLRFSLKEFSSRN